MPQVLRAQVQFMGTRHLPNKLQCADRQQQRLQQEQTDNIDDDDKGVEMLNECEWETDIAIAILFCFCHGKIH